MVFKNILSPFIKSHINHEETGAEIAGSILIEYGYNQDEINSIKSLILVTKAIAIPNNNLESIIRDSDLEYLGSNDFERISEILKKEWLQCGVVSSEEQFYKIQLDFLINHQFHTEYMRKKGKKLNEFFREEIFEPLEESVDPTFFYFFLHS